jgi:hypothetical protein
MKKRAEVRKGGGGASKEEDERKREGPASLANRRQHTGGVEGTSAANAKGKGI